MSIFFSSVTSRRLVVLAAVLLFALNASAQRQMERLGRGTVVLHSATAQAYIGWRLLATDPAVLRPPRLLTQGWLIKN